MSRDISLLPDDLRKKREEEERRRRSGGTALPADAGFHVPGIQEVGNKKLEAGDRTIDTQTPNSQPPTPRRRNGSAARSALHIPDAVPARALKGITLIPTEFQKATVHPAWTRTATGVATIVAIACITVGAVVLERMIGTLEATAAAREVESAALEAEAKAVTSDLDRSAGTLRRARAIRGLLATHLGWDSIASALEERTLPGVSYDAFAADAQGTIALSVRAPSVRTAAEQIVAWRSTPIVRSVESSSLASALDALGVVRGVRFDLRMTIATDAFLMHPPTTNAAQ
ncbi:hypothetical protein HY480_02060 [Candidatus Uhrbacteria bacterium]|nr:hypothetical protein [Candidatus Uhrbacteria bacterium]